MQRKSHEGVYPTDLSALAHSAVKAALRERGSVVVLVDHVDQHLHGVLHVPALVHCVSPQLEHTTVSTCAQAGAIPEYPRQP